MAKPFPSEVHDVIVAAIAKLLKRMPRTSLVIAELERGLLPKLRAEHVELVIEVEPEHVRAVALATNVTLLRGAPPGSPRKPGAGRPKGRRDSKPRERVSPFAADIVRMDRENPKLTDLQIARALGTSRQTVNKFRPKKPQGNSDGSDNFTS